MADREPPARQSNLSGRTQRLLRGVIAAGVAIGFVHLLGSRWDEVDRARLALYAVLLLGYSIGERLAWRGRRDLGSREHTWLRWALLAVWLLVMLGGPLEHALDPHHGFAATVTGVILALAGAGVRLWSMATLGAFFSPHIETWSDQVLVQHGPYRRVRHPSYLGAMLYGLGMPLVLGTRVAFGLALVLVALLVRRLIWEERVLAYASGHPILSHAARSRR